MRKFLGVGIVGLLAVLASCSKAPVKPSEVTTQQTVNPDKAYMGATINGKTWRTDSIYAYKVAHSGNDSNKVNLYISAVLKTDNPVTSFYFNITDYSGNGTYVIDPPANAATYYVGSRRFYATSGQLVLTTDTGKSLRGTFTFKTDSFAVSDGSFTVPMP